ncbi:MAG TPA: DUF177 domain-containing protein [Aquifex aeolicus]|uniref:DUF177 domain-containing protein n=1 Tax=Aquifex aeolicus TaxID=63363 RepID=A0A9D0YNB0_AQUAO|nr:DUF177 domain-containing protein [Aquificales bacterium]HIP98130.1 DUF177 domain-containing protein [Aquifex aeolicus]HIQ26010.1 DUF177 domain-containing protein [Aquifex aeolicus]
MKEIKLDLKRIFEKEKQPYFRAQYEFTPEELKIPADVGEINSPVKVEVYIIKNPRGEGYKVNYTIIGNIDLTCSRCLEVFSKDLGGEHTVFAQSGYEEREHLRESDLNTYSLEGNILNLTQLIREQILLDLPYKPLCHPDCRGIELEDSQTAQSPFGELKKLLKK